MARTKTKRFPFSKTTLSALPTPIVGRVYYHDQRTPGLCLCLTAAGTRTFYCYRWANRRPERIRLGKFPELTVEQARDLARAIVGDIAKGEDPAARRREAREAPTLQAAFDHWMEYHAKPHKRTWQEDRRQYEAFLKPWAAWRLETIRKTEIQTLHATVGRESGPYAANRMLALLASLFAKAADIGYKGDNPAKGVAKFRERERDRYLRGDEAARFFQSLANEPEPFGDFFALCLLTGARRGNVQSMQWQDVNLGARLWRIPAEEAKADEVIVVPLLPQAVEILTRRRELTADSPWVFPSHGKTGHLVEVKSAWARILKRAGIVDLRVHDLRRTLGSYMAMQGASLWIVGKALGHRQSSTTEIYARLQTDPIRAAMTAGAQALLTAAENGKQHQEGPSDAQTQDTDQD